MSKNKFLFNLFISTCLVNSNIAASETTQLTEKISGPSSNTLLSTEREKSIDFFLDDYLYKSFNIKSSQNESQNFNNNLIKNESFSDISDISNKNARLCFVILEIAKICDFKLGEFCDEVGLDVNDITLKFENSYGFFDQDLLDSEQAKNIRLLKLARSLICSGFEDNLTMDKLIKIKNEEVKKFTNCSKEDYQKTEFNEENKSIKTINDKKNKDYDLPELIDEAFEEAMGGNYNHFVDFDDNLSLGNSDNNGDD